MIKRTYYSIRTGTGSTEKKIDFDTLKKIFSTVFKKLWVEGYFQQHFGIDCTDGYQPGELGEEIDAMIYVNLRKHNLYPVPENLPNYTEEDLFDMIEFLHDHCSKGITGFHHAWNNCGYHYHEFNDFVGRRHYRELLNPILREYNDGFEISEGGEILSLAGQGLSNLFEANIPTTDTENITDKMNNAILKFRRYKSTLEDRRDAIRELADVLEFLRSDIKKHLERKDEGDLFNIANNFGIRHHNKEQKTDYDKAVWYSWIFYHYLATIHTVLRMINKGQT